MNSGNNRSHKIGRRILLKGATAVKQVRHYTHPDVEANVTPLIVLQDGADPWGEYELHCGLVLQCTPRSLLGEEKTTGGEDSIDPLNPFEISCTCSAWVNPVRWWRALQLLAGMPVLDHRNTHLELWIATGRPGPDDTFSLERIEEIRGMLAPRYDYEEIMRRPVPLEIVQLTIQLADEGFDLHSARYDLTNEVEAGSVRWSQELKRIGVDHPDYRKAYWRARMAIVERYKNHLFSYAAYAHHPYAHAHREKSFIMLGIEVRICATVERGIEQEHGMDITAAVSILLEEIGTDTILEELEKKHSRNRKRDRPFVRPTPGERLAQVCSWLREYYHFPLSCPPHPSKDELGKLLHRLYDRWGTMPIIQPLVD